MFYLYFLMEKEGGFFIFIGILVIILILIMSVGIYFYNFHVFKTLRVCLSDGKNTNLPCENNSQCRDFAKTLMPMIDLEGAPYFINVNFQRVFNEAIYCEQTCFIRDIRGVNPNTQKFELIEKCEKNETEITVDIKGKEAIEVFKWMKEKGFDF